MAGGWLGDGWVLGEKRGKHVGKTYLEMEK